MRLGCFFIDRLLMSGIQRREISFLGATRAKFVDMSIIFSFNLFICGIVLGLELVKESLVSLFSSNSAALGHFDVVGKRNLLLVGISFEGIFSINVIPKVSFVNIL